MKRTAGRAPAERRLQRPTRVPRSVIEERDAVARDVHVGLAQSATAVLLGLDILRSTDLQTIPAELERLDTLVMRNGREVRRLMAFLQAPRVGGLTGAMQTYVEDVETSDSPIACTIDEGAVDPTTSDRAFRYIHRSLSAIERSGARGPITISVSPTDDGALAIRIDFAASAESGRSLQGVATETGGAPVVVRKHDEGVELGCVIR